MWEVEWQGSAENETLAARQLAEVPDSAPESPSKKKAWVHPRSQIAYPPCGGNGGLGSSGPTSGEGVASNHFTVAGIVDINNQRRQAFHRHNF